VKNTNIVTLVNLDYFKYMKKIKSFNAFKFKHMKKSVWIYNPKIH